MHMRGSTYPVAGIIRLTDGETADRYCLVEQPDGSYRCHCNESFQVTRPDRRAAVRWAMDEARIHERAARR